MSGPVLTTPEDVVNAALSGIGLKIRIGSLLEGSEPAKAALDIYGQTRDALLRSDDWGFARGDETLAATKTGLNDYTVMPWSSTYPPYPWKYQFTYPADCLKVRNIIYATPGFALNFDPQPPRWDTPNDSSLAPAVTKVIREQSGRLVHASNLFYTPFQAALAERLCALSGLDRAARPSPARRRS